VGKKRTLGAALRFPGRRPRQKQRDQDRTLSEIIKEMGLRLFKEPEAAASLPAVETAILLASAAWNAALGDRPHSEVNSRRVRQ
jgi:hypothetical protein